MRGFVAKIATKSGVAVRTGKAWTKYSFIVEDEQGVETKWITYGFEQPPFKEGDFIEFEVRENNGFADYKKGSGRIVANPPARAAARSSAAASPQRGQVAGVEQAAGKPGQAEAGRGVGAVDGGSGGADRQTQIVLQHSQEMAIALVSVLLANDALPISATKSKAGEAKRFDEIVAAVDKLTVKFHNDVATGRLLSVVADMGVVSTKADAPLPEGGEEKGGAETEEEEF